MNRVTRILHLCLVLFLIFGVISSRANTLTCHQQVATFATHEHEAEHEMTSQDEGASSRIGAHQTSQPLKNDCKSERHCAGSDSCCLSLVLQKSTFLDRLSLQGLNITVLMTWTSRSTIPATPPPTLFVAVC
jgi:hypothetical protein